MSFLRRFDFNNPTGYFSVILVAIAISLLFFSLAYMSEGLGWISGDSPDDISLDVGWNWIRGSGITFIIAIVLFGVSASLLNKNHKLSKWGSPVFGSLDLNQPKGLLGLTSLSVAFVFFLNSGIYRLEALRWYYASFSSGQSWFLTESSSWITSSYIMALIGIILAATGWLLLAKQWKR